MPDESLEEKMRISKEIRENVIKAEQSIKDKNLLDAAKYYESASNLSKSLGHTEIAQDYLKKALELREEIGEAPIASVKTQDPLQIVINMADKAITAGNFSEAARIYEEAARKYPDQAKKLLAEALSLRNKEKDMVVTKKEIIRKAESAEAYESTLEQIKMAEQKGEYLELVTLYGRAAVLAERSGRREQAGEYRKAAIEAKRKASREMRAESKGERRNLVQEYTDILKQIKMDLDDKNWREAAEGYLTAAKLAIELEEYERAKTYKEKAAQYQEQAASEEYLLELRQKRKQILAETKNLDIEKDTDKMSKNYEDIIRISKELGIVEGLEEVNKDLNKIQKIKRRKKILQEANDAIEKNDHLQALELFQKALRISMDLNEPTKVEGFRRVIEELKGKVDKVSRDRRIIEERAELITEAKAAFKEDPPNIEKAIDNYKEAARISIELGEDEVAQAYLQTAKRVEEDQGLILERENFAKDAEAAIKEKKYLMASDYFLQAAKFSRKLGDEEEADNYEKKSKALKDLAEEL